MGAVILFLLAGCALPRESCAPVVPPILWDGEYTELSQFDSGEAVTTVTVEDARITLTYASGVQRVFSQPASQ